MAHLGCLFQLCSPPTHQQPLLWHPLGLVRSALSKADPNKRLQLVPEVGLRPFVKGILEFQAWSRGGDTGSGWTCPLALWTFSPVRGSE